MMNLLKRITSSLCLLLTFLITNAQEKIIYRYFNLDSVEVSYEGFQKNREINRYDNVQAYFKNQNDTMFVKIVKRKVTGRISELQSNQILSYFKSLQSNIDVNITTVFQYFQGDDPCSRSGYGYQVAPWDDRDRNFETSLKKKYNINFVNIKSNLAGLEYRTTKPENWLNDRYSLLKRFFPLHYPCGSFMILKPNGEYYIYYAEYGLHNTFEGLKELKVEKAK
jgi:hypothetical protein